MNEFFRKNILKGFYFSLGIHFLLILFFFVVQSISKEEGTTDAVVRILKYSELGPPPSISLENSEVAKGRLAKKEKFAVPKPVKKIQKDTVEIAKQTLSGSKEGEGSGLGVGDVKIISEETVKEVKPKPEAKYYAAVDYMPEPKGGYGAIQSRVVIPEPAKQNNVSGKVLVKTYIDEMGKVVRT
ncbi:MAG: hypothetical protein WC727_05235, partial [Ignavibacteriaceae bacterium]